MRCRRRGRWATSSRRAADSSISITGSLSAGATVVLVVWASYSAVPHLVGFASGVDGGAAGRSEVREVLRAEGGDGGGVKRPQDVFGESRTTLMKECLGHAGNAKRTGLPRFEQGKWSWPRRPDGALSMFEQCLERFTGFLSPVTLALYGVVCRVFRFANH